MPPSARDSCSRRSDVGGRVGVGGNVRMNAGGKQAVLWAPRRHWRRGEVTPSALAQVCASDTTRQDPDARRPSRAGISTPGAKVERTAAARDPGRDVAQEGLGKDSPKVLAGCRHPEEGCDGIVTSARWISTACRARAPGCLECFGNARNAVRRSSRSATTVRARREERRPRARASGSRSLDDRTKAAAPRQSSACASDGGPKAALPKMVLVVDIVGDDADAVSRQRRRRAHRQPRSGRVPRVNEARRKFWPTASAPRRSARHNASR